MPSNFRNDVFVIGQVKGKNQFVKLTIEVKHVCVCIVCVWSALVSKLPYNFV